MSGLAVTELVCLFFFSIMFSSFSPKKIFWSSYNYIIAGGFHRLIIYLATGKWFDRTYSFISLLRAYSGLMKVYHARNEYCLLSDMCQGYRIFVSIISQLEDWDGQQFVLLMLPEYSISRNLATRHNLAWDCVVRWLKSELNVILYALMSFIP